MKYRAVNDAVSEISKSGGLETSGTETPPFRAGSITGEAYNRDFSRGNAAEDKIFGYI